MTKTILSYLLLIISISVSGLKAVSENTLNLLSDTNKVSIERQVLFNGRLWKNQFSNINGHQFLSTSDFLTGSVKIDDDTFDSVKIRYDIFNDELNVQKDAQTIIQLNKELINCFTLYYYDENLNFLNFDNDTISALKGYWQILYDASVKIYVRYTKDILPSTITNGPPKFNQVNTIYLLKDGKYYRINTKRELLGIFTDKLEQNAIKRFIKSNYIRISRQNPVSIRRVFEYYETLVD